MVGTIHRCKHCGYICVSGGIKNEQAPSICPKCGQQMSDGILGGERRYKKELRQMEIEESPAYKAMFVIAKYMDKWFLDPILGFFLPALGDFITSACSLPFIYVAAFKVRSLPLTLAVIFNMLRDMLIGMIPFYIGDICDVFHRCYVENSKLIVGFVEDDREIISEVNRKAVWTAILIALFCYLIYLLVGWTIQLTEWIGSLF